MTENSSNACINCGRPVQTEYCPNCGQKANVERISLHSLFLDLQFKLFGFDSKYLRTCKDLTSKPGQVASYYIKGNRVTYIGPVHYFFIAITILILLIALLDIDMIAYTSENDELLSFGELTEDQLAQQQESKLWIFNHFKLMHFLLIPFYLIVTLLLFRKEGYNTLEKMVFILYSQAHTQWASYLSLLTFKLSGISLTLAVLLISGLYTGFFANQFFNRGSGWLRFIKGALIYPLSMVLIIAFIVVFSLTGLLLFPEETKNILNL